MECAQLKPARKTNNITAKIEILNINIVGISETHGTESGKIAVKTVHYTIERIQIMYILA